MIRSAARIMSVALFGSLVYLTQPGSLSSVPPDAVAFDAGLQLRGTIRSSIREAFLNRIRLKCDGPMRHIVRCSVRKNVNSVGKGPHLRILFFDFGYLDKYVLNAGLRTGELQFLKEELRT